MKMKNLQVEFGSVLLQQIEESKNIICINICIYKNPARSIILRKFSNGRNQNYYPNNPR